MIEISDAYPLFGMKMKEYYGDAQSIFYFRDTLELLFQLS